MVFFEINNFKYNIPQKKKQYGKPAPKDEIILEHEKA